MQLTPQKNEVLKVDTSGRRSFVVALFGVSGAVVSALLAFPLVRFVTYPLRKGASASDVVGRRPGAGLCLAYRTHRENHYLGTPRRVADHLIPDGGIRVAIQGWAIPHIIAYLSASGVLGPLGGR